ncbi:uncharacterized protein SEPMUDRAFT_111727 [Sphaerulina musiva SO2202]|uniref:Uncharacterized protein n=1 Tax=Sphaerulina musiva (strain SO2202) TaxID=692275 RepID=M3CW54_SPHMS|nr:uncharacterized protein SEPMUDRAFT_111727 [Sphaerulina musiva SO2202]EMF08372.1 hypothetical protein SEPMUDRAFT_111727 [Sphaerulina musiva SO2202]
MASSRYSTAPSFTTMHGPQKRTVDCYFNLFERPRPLRCCNPDRPSTGYSEATERNWPTRQSSLPHDVLPYFTRHRPLTPTAFLYTPEHYVQANDERHREMHATCEEEEDIGDEMTAELESTTTTSVPLRKPISQTRLDAPLPSSPPLDSPPTPPNLHSTLTQTSNVSTTTTNNNNIEETTTTTTTASSVPPQCPVHHSPNTCLYCRTNPPITINTTNTPPPYPSITHPTPLCRVQHPSHYHTTADGPVFLNSRRQQQEEQQYPTCLLENYFPTPPSMFPGRGGLTVTSPRTVLRGFYREEVRSRIVKVRERIGFCRFCFCRWGRGMKSGGWGGCFSSSSSSSRSRRMDGDEDNGHETAVRAGRMYGNRGRNRNLTTPTTTPTTMRMGMRRMGSVRTMELD